MEPFEDPNDPRNGPEHHAGGPCIERGCDNPAGTHWSPHWCFDCNAERMRRVDRSLQEIRDRLAAMEEREASHGMG